MSRFPPQIKQKEYFYLLWCDGDCNLKPGASSRTKPLNNNKTQTKDLRGCVGSE